MFSMISRGDFNGFVPVNITIRGLFKKYADCLNCAARVGFQRIRLVSLVSYRSAD